MSPFVLHVASASARTVPRLVGLRIWIRREALVAKLYESLAPSTSPSTFPLFKLEGGWLLSRLSGLRTERGLG